MQNALHQALFVCTFEVLYVGASIARPQILLAKSIVARRNPSIIPFKIRNSLNFGGRAMLAPTDVMRAHFVIPILRKKAGAVSCTG